MKELLENVKKLVDKEKKQREDKGESFNIFQITGKQSAEQHTHSAFIAELLNPNGSHNEGEKFLHLFFKVIEKSIEFNDDIGESIVFYEVLKNNPRGTIFKTLKKSILKKKAEVNVEKNIGEKVPKPQKKGDLKAEGGRLDILLKLKSNYLIIENKIYAPDQLNQIIRYFNYKKDKNIVFFLTLDGKEPTDESKGTLVSGVHFFCISYEDQIIDWLKQCLEIEGLKPNIEASLRQYLLLILKLTNQMEDQPGFNKIVYENHDSAKAIYDNYKKSIIPLRNKFRKEVFEALDNDTELKEFKIELQAPKGHKMIFIKPENSKLFFGIAAFSDSNYRNEGNKLFIGIRNNSENTDWWWRSEEKFSSEEFKKKLLSKKIDDEFLEFSDEFLVEIKNDDSKNNMVINEIVINVISFIQKHKNNLKILSV